MIIPYKNGTHIYFYKPYYKNVNNLLIKTKKESIYRKDGSLLMVVDRSLIPDIFELNTLNTNNIVIISNTPLVGEDIDLLECILNSNHCDIILSHAILDVIKPYTSTSENQEITGIIPILSSTINEISPVPELFIKGDSGNGDENISENEAQ